MERKVVIQDWQKVTQEDFDNLGEFPREAFDDLIGNLLIPDKGYCGFSTVASGTGEVTVSEGRIIYDGVMYLNDTEGGSVVSLLSSLPVATRRYVALTAWGQEIDTETEPRTFLTDATTRATVARAVSTENRRWANISTVVGTEGPDPTKPAVAANVVPFAWVLLDTSGVVSIEMDTTYLVPTLRALDTWRIALDAWKTSVGTMLDTLRSDLAGLAARIKGLARMNYVLDIARDLARTKEAQNLPESFVKWSADHYIINDQSDTSHVDYLAKVEEGCRFPPANSHTAQISLLNQYDPNAAQADFFVLPAYDEVARLDVLGKDSEQNISTYGFQTVNFEQCERQRCTWRYGGWYTICTNYLVNESGVPYGTFDPTTRLYTWNTDVYDVGHAGETIQLDNGQTLGGEHHQVRVRRAWLDCWTEPYWRLVTTTDAVAGSCIAQTFLNAQDGWLTSIELYFTRVAASGNVEVFIVGTDNGAPDMTQTIAHVTLDNEDMHVYPTATKISFVPTFLASGRRYALVIVTPSNHYVAILEGNKFMQGTLFYSDDGSWFMGDLTKDLAFKANFAKFRSPRVEIQLNALELDDGIESVRITCQSITPPQCLISWEVLDAEDGWVPLSGLADPNVASPFVGLPPMIPFRVVLVGTTDSMPGIGVGSNSRTITTRPRSDFRHISTIRDVSPSTVNTVYIDLRIEEWRGTPHHTVVAKILTGATYETVETYDTLEEYASPDDPDGTWIKKFTFTLASPVSSYRIRLEGTTDNVLTCCHLAERIDVSDTV